MSQGIEGVDAGLVDYYRRRAREYEAIYDNMPPFGLGKAGTLSRIGAGRESSRERITRLDREA